MEHDASPMRQPTIHGALVSDDGLTCRAFRLLRRSFRRRSGRKEDGRSQLPISAQRRAVQIQSDKLRHPVPHLEDDEQKEAQEDFEKSLKHNRYEMLAHYGQGIVDGLESAGGRRDVGAAEAA